MTGETTTGGVEEFSDDALHLRTRAVSASEWEIAPARRDPYEAQAPCDVDDGEFDPSQPASFKVEHPGLIDGDDLEWAAWCGLRHMIRTREGATFLKLAEDVFIIGVVGGQPLHHDRGVTGGDDPALSPHTWNIVAEGSGGQILLCEVLEATYEHMTLDRGSWIYLNTSNMHAVSRNHPDAETVLVQVTGYGTGSGDAAMRRIAEVLAARPAIVRGSGL
jgi:hypothetical protein